MPGQDFTVHLTDAQKEEMEAIRQEVKNKKTPIPTPIPKSFFKAKEMYPEIVEVHVADEANNAWDVYGIRHSKEGPPIWKHVKRIDVDLSNHLPRIPWIAFKIGGRKVTDEILFYKSLLSDQTPEKAQELKDASEIRTGCLLTTNEDTNRIVKETIPSLHWAVQRMCIQLQHTHEKIGDYPDSNFENVDPPYQHIRALVTGIYQGLELIESLEINEEDVAWETKKTR